MNIHQLVGGFGVIIILALCFALSSHKRSVKWRVIVWGLLLQFILGFLILKTAPGKHFFGWINEGVLKLMDYHELGARFVFNALAIPPDKPGTMGFFFAFQVLTTIIFFSAFIAVLYHFGIMQFVIAMIAKVMRITMGTSGGETLSASANIFVGQIEAPLAIRPYLPDMTRSELLCVMIGGMATISGGLLGAFIGMLKGYFPSIGAHLLTASVMSAPAALLISKLLIPETGTPRTSGAFKMVYQRPHKNLVEAITNGGEIGLRTALNIGAILIIFVALISLADGIFEWVISLFGVEGFTLQKLFGFIFAPLAWIMGVPWKDCNVVGQLLGVKTIFNEVVAYTQLGELLSHNKEALAERSIMIASYALCGFANFLSIGLQVSGIGAMAPERKSDLASLGLRALLGGLLAACLTAAIAGIIIP